MAGETTPTVYVIAGPNGAGKTTFSERSLPKFADCLYFLNADRIAAELNPSAPETQNVRAGRILLTRFHNHVKRQESFSFETTLSGRTYVRLLSAAKQDGYRVVMFFLWLPTVEMALLRVANRVRQGGHFVPEVDIRRRFATGIRNLFQLYRPLLDHWRLYNAIEMSPSPIAVEVDGKLDVLNDPMFSQVLSQL